MNLHDLRLRGVRLTLNLDRIDFVAGTDSAVECARLEIESNFKALAAELRAERTAEREAPELFSALAVGERLRLAYAHSTVADLAGNKALDRAVGDLKRACRAADERIATAAVAVGLDASELPLGDALAARGWVLTALAMRRAARVPA